MWFFFFKQKTAYEMRISDWSSDVCSSDLPARRRLAIVGCGGPAALGCEPVMNRDHRQIEHPCHLGAQRRVGVEVAEHEPAAVEEYHRRAGLTRFARIEKPQRARAGGAVHPENFHARKVARPEERRGGTGGVGKGRTRVA